MTKTLPTLIAVAALLSLSTAASADETTDKKAAATEKSSKGYGYTFDDDALNAGVSGTTGFVIKVRPKGVRNQLIRPRASFVPEMLKSVEAL